MSEREAVGTAWDARQKELHDLAAMSKFREDHAEATQWIRVRREAVDAIEPAASVAAVSQQVKKLGEQRVRGSRVNGSASRDAAMRASLTRLTVHPPAPPPPAAGGGNDDVRLRLTPMSKRSLRSSPTASAWSAKGIRPPTK